MSYPSWTVIVKLHVYYMRVSFIRMLYKFKMRKKYDIIIIGFKINVIYWTIYIVIVIISNDEKRHKDFLFYNFSIDRKRCNKRIRRRRALFRQLIQSQVSLFYDYKMLYCIVESKNTVNYLILFFIKINKKLYFTCQFFKNYCRHYNVSTKSGRICTYQYLYHRYKIIKL